MNQAPSITTASIDTTGMDTIPQEFGQDIAQGTVKQAIKAGGAVKNTKEGSLRAKLADLNVMAGFNVRGDTPAYRAHVRRIAEDMAANGYDESKPLKVIVGEDGKLAVVGGHTRSLALGIAISELGAQIDDFPVTVMPKGTTAEDIQAALVKDNDGMALRPIEVAVVCKRFAAWGWDSKRIGAKLAMSAAYVDELLSLLSAPAALVALVEDGTVAASTAVTAIKDMGAKAAAEAIVEVAKTKKAAAKPAKPGKAAEPVKVVPSDIGQSKAQKALKKAADKGMALKPGETVTRAPTAKEAAALLKDVWADQGYDKLSPDLIKRIDFFFGN